MAENLTVRMDDGTRARLEQLAVQRRRERGELATRATLIREAIAAMLDRELVVAPRKRSAAR